MRSEGRHASATERKKRESVFFSCVAQTEQQKHRGGERHRRDSESTAKRQAERVGEERQNAAEGAGLAGVRKEGTVLSAVCYYGGGGARAAKRKQREAARAPASGSHEKARRGRMRREKDSRREGKGEYKKQRKSKSKRKSGAVKDMARQEEARKEEETRSSMGQSTKERSDRKSLSWRR